MERMFVLKKLSPTQRPTEGQNIFGDLLKTTAFKSCSETRAKKPIANYSGLPAVSFLRLTHSEAPEVSQ